jgi:hypothetical protein
MPRIATSLFFSFALIAGTAALAHAQSVATAPPNEDNSQDARTLPYGSTQSFFPKPGGSEVIRENTPPPPAAAANGASQYYPSGPKPN